MFLNLVQILCSSSSTFQGTKLGHKIRGLGDGRLRDIEASSSNVESLEKELEAKRAARKVANAARVKMKQRMQKAEGC
ncbi:Hypothetical predicted protein [Olea europaea subsp. europaea]|uniref:Uncharacterized protein n=1 Tax=Olea europaea subsp. europaea TaxID=158383 RepID=A0A8S0QIS8_OLEEU|nr:Hypothetical predicted protein [Olea europaea subsp. europaea]